MTTSHGGAPVITGIGVLSPNGVGLDQYWKATVAGVNGIDTIRGFDAGSYPSRLAGEIDAFDAKQHVPRRLLPQTDRMTRMSLAAADWALADAGIDPTTVPEYEMSVCTASSAGGFEFGQRELEKLWGRGPHHVSAYQSFAWFYAVNTGQISIRHGMRGSSGVVVADQAGGLDALAMARRRQRNHGSRLVVSGAVDSTLCPWGWVAHIAGGGMTESDDPGGAYLPFDKRASGHVVGEGGAILVLEDAKSAHERGVTGYGTLAGYASTFDGANEEPGGGLRRAAELALADARLEPEDIDVVLADAAGTPERDAAEAHAIRSVFGPRGVPVTVPKSMTGRMLAGAGPLDVVAALLALRDGIIPPTVNVTDLDPAYELDLVRDEPRFGPLGTALVLARGEGSFNSAVVLTRDGPDLTRSVCS